MLTGKKVLSLAWVATAAVVAQAQINKAGNGYLIRVRYRPGETIRVRYQTIIETQSQGGKLDFLPEIWRDDRIITTKVVGVDSRGRAKIVSSGSEIDRKVPFHRRLGSKLIVDDRNRLINGSGFRRGVMLPKCPIKLGGVWTAPMPAELGDMGLSNSKKGPRQADYYLAGFETLGGIHCAKVRFTPEAYSGSLIQFDIHGTAYLRVEDGSVQQLQAESTLVSKEASFGGLSIVRRTLIASRLEN